jgi:glycosyltransferase involved in cell wall biosynthesis
VRSIDLLIPCHNEADGAAEFLAAINATIKELQHTSCPEGGEIHFKLVIMDDGSTDENLPRENRFLLWGIIIAAICIIFPAWHLIYPRLRCAVKRAAPRILIGPSWSLGLVRPQPRYALLA